MRIDGDAAAIVTDRQAITRAQRYLDPGGMAGDRLVHRIVQHFGGEMMQRALVRAADIHSGTAADGLEPLQHLDRGSIIGFGCACALAAEQIV